MVWDTFKRLFGARPGEARKPEDVREAGNVRASEDVSSTGDTHSTKDAPEPPRCSWIEAADNPWGVRVLDVRPVTHTMTSTSADPNCATNAVSFGGEDGLCFVGQAPPVPRTIDASLRFPIDSFLADGVLFIPQAMEHKWALFYHGGKIICVRSWLRSVRLLASVVAHGTHVEVTQIQGAFGGEDEDAEFTRRLFDCLMHTHALDTVYPVPLPADMTADPDSIALWCMSLLGNKAAVATPHPFARRDPERPLRTHSLFHIAVARNDTAAVERQLAAGVPVDLLAGDGLGALHWAMASGPPAMLKFLLGKGAAVDLRSVQGATPLMNAVQSRSLEKAALLLDHGADVNARDHRGFTALHRAAELGLSDLAQLLVQRGAVDSEVSGQTARSLAQRGGHADIVAALGAKVGTGSQAV